MMKSEKADGGIDAIADIPTAPETTLSFQLERHFLGFSTVKLYMKQRDALQEFLNSKEHKKTTNHSVSTTATFNSNVPKCVGETLSAEDDASNPNTYQTKCSSSLSAGHVSDLSSSDAVKVVTDWLKRNEFPLTRPRLDSRTSSGDSWQSSTASSVSSCATNTISYHPMTSLSWGGLGEQLDETLYRCRTDSEEDTGDTASLGSWRTANNQMHGVQLLAKEIASNFVTLHPSFDKLFKTFGTPIQSIESNHLGRIDLEELSPFQPALRVLRVVVVQIVAGEKDPGTSYRLLETHLYQQDRRSFATALSPLIVRVAATETPTEATSRMLSTLILPGLLKSATTKAKTLPPMKDCFEAVMKHSHMTSDTLGITGGYTLTLDRLNRHNSAYCRPSLETAVLLYKVECNLHKVVASLSENVGPKAPMRVLKLPDELQVSVIRNRHTNLPTVTWRTHRKASNKSYNYFSTSPPLFFMSLKWFKVAAIGDESGTDQESKTLMSDSITTEDQKAIDKDPSMLPPYLQSLFASLDHHVVMTCIRGKAQSVDYCNCETLMTSIIETLNQYARRWCMLTTELCELILDAIRKNSTFQVPGQATMLLEFAKQKLSQTPSVEKPETFKSSHTPVECKEDVGGSSVGDKVMNVVECVASGDVRVSSTGSLKVDECHENEPGNSPTNQQGSVDAATDLQHGSGIDDQQKGTNKNSCSGIGKPPLSHTQCICSKMTNVQADAFKQSMSEETLKQLYKSLKERVRNMISSSLSPAESEVVMLLFPNACWLHVDVLNGGFSPSKVLLASSVNWEGAVEPGSVIKIDQENALEIERHKMQFIRCYLGDYVPALLAFASHGSVAALRMELCGTGWSQQPPAGILTGNSGAQHDQVAHVNKLLCTLKDVYETEVEMHKSSVSHRATKHTNNNSSRKTGLEATKIRPTFGNVGSIISTVCGDILSNQSLANDDSSPSHLHDTIEHTSVGDNSVTPGFPPSRDSQNSHGADRTGEDTGLINLYLAYDIDNLLLKEVHLCNPKTLALHLGLQTLSETEKVYDKNELFPTWKPSTSPSDPRKLKPERKNSVQSKFSPTKQARGFFASRFRRQSSEKCDDEPNDDQSSVVLNGTTGGALVPPEQKPAKSVVPSPVANDTLHVSPTKGLNKKSLSERRRVGSLHLPLDSQTTKSSEPSLKETASLPQMPSHELGIALSQLFPTARDPTVRQEYVEATSDHSTRVVHADRRSSAPPGLLSEISQGLHDVQTGTGSESSTYGPNVDDFFRYFEAVMECLDGPRYHRFKDGKVLGNQGIKGDLLNSPRLGSLGPSSSKRKSTLSKSARARTNPVRWRDTLRSVWQRTSFSGGDKSLSNANNVNSVIEEEVQQGVFAKDEQRKFGTLAPVPDSPSKKSKLHTTSTQEPKLSDKSVQESLKVSDPGARKRFSGTRGRFGRSETPRLFPVTANYPVRIVHGDLNGRNIVIDAEEGVWLIDWPTLKRHHALCDLAKLETSCLLEYTPLDDGQDDDYSQSIMMAYVLSQQASLNIKKDPLPSAERIGLTGKFVFAWDTVCTIRDYVALYCEQRKKQKIVHVDETRYNEHTCQMHFAILSQSIKALKYRDLSALQKRLALATAVLQAHQILLVVDEQFDQDQSLRKTGERKSNASKGADMKRNKSAIKPRSGFRKFQLFGNSGHVKRYTVENESEQPEADHVGSENVYKKAFEQHNLPKYSSTRFCKLLEAVLEPIRKKHLLLQRFSQKSSEICITPTATRMQRRMNSPELPISQPLSDHLYIHHQLLYFRDEIRRHRYVYDFLSVNNKAADVLEYEWTFEQVDQEAIDLKVTQDKFHALQQMRLSDSEIGAEFLQECFGNAIQSPAANRCISVSAGPAQGKSTFLRKLVLAAAVSAWQSRGKEQSNVEPNNSSQASPPLYKGRLSVVEQSTISRAPKLTRQNATSEDLIQGSDNDQSNPGYNAGPVRYSSSKIKIMEQQSLNVCQPAALNETTTDVDKTTHQCSLHPRRMSMHNYGTKGLELQRETEQPRRKLNWGRSVSSPSIVFTATTASCTSSRKVIKQNKTDSPSTLRRTAQKNIETMSKTTTVGSVQDSSVKFTQIDGQRDELGEAVSSQTSQTRSGLPVDFQSKSKSHTKDAEPETIDASPPAPTLQRRFTAREGSGPLTVPHKQLSGTVSFFPADATDLYLNRLVPVLVPLSTISRILERKQFRNMSSWNKNNLKELSYEDDVLLTYLAEKYGHRSARFKMLKMAYTRSKLVICFDGFDEVGSAKSRRVLEQYITEQLLQSNCRIIITSRTSSVRFESSKTRASFTHLRMCPLSREQQNVLVERKMDGQPKGHVEAVKSLLVRPEYQNLTRTPMMIAVVIHAFYATLTRLAAATDNETSTLLDTDHHGTRQAALAVKHLTVASVFDHGKRLMLTVADRYNIRDSRQRALKSRAPKAKTMSSSLHHSRAAHDDDVGRVDLHSSSMSRKHVSATGNVDGALVLENSNAHLLKLVDAEFEKVFLRKLAFQLHANQAREFTVEECLSLIPPRAKFMELLNLLLRSCYEGRVPILKYYDTVAKRDYFSSKSNSPPTSPTVSSPTSPTANGSTSRPTSPTATSRPTSPTPTSPTSPTPTSPTSPTPTSPTSPTAPLSGTRGVAMPPTSQSSRTDPVALYSTEAARHLHHASTGYFTFSHLIWQEHLSALYICDKLNQVYRETLNNTGGNISGTSLVPNDFVESWTSLMKNGLWEIFQEIGRTGPREDLVDVAGAREHVGAHSEVKDGEETLHFSPGDGLHVLFNDQWWRGVLDQVADLLVSPLQDWFLFLKQDMCSIPQV